MLASRPHFRVYASEQSPGTPTHGDANDVKILVIDIGGSHVKVLMSGQRTPTKLDSGPDLTPRQMMKAVLKATEDWDYDAVTIGYPGPIVKNHPAKDPINLGKGWVRFDYKKAFKCPVRMYRRCDREFVHRRIRARSQGGAHLDRSNASRAPGES